MFFFLNLCFSCCVWPPCDMKVRIFRLCNIPGLNQYFAQENLTDADYSVCLCACSDLKRLQANIKY